MAIIRTEWGTARKPYYESRDAGKSRSRAFRDMVFPHYQQRELGVPFETAISGYDPATGQDVSVRRLRPDGNITDRNTLEVTRQVRNQYGRLVPEISVFDSQNPTTIFLRERKGFRGRPAGLTVSYSWTKPPRGGKDYPYRPTPRPTPEGVGELLSV